MTVRGFEEVLAKSRTGGFDTAKLHDQGLGDEEVETGSRWARIDIKGGLATQLSTVYSPVCKHKS